MAVLTDISVFFSKFQSQEIYFILRWVTIIRSDKQALGQDNRASGSRWILSIKVLYLQEESLLDVEPKLVKLLTKCWRELVALRGTCQF